MYNGLGLQTARGSGTNGYVQRNLSFNKRSSQDPNYVHNQPPPKPARKPSADILVHRNKRRIEVECLQYEEELLESKRYTWATSLMLIRQVFCRRSKGKDE